MTRKRLGFTVLELVTVIAIIALLIALLVVAANHLIGGAKEKQTHVTLENLRNMMAEMEVAVGLNQQPSTMWVNNVQLKAPNQSFDIWHYYDITSQQGPRMGALYGDTNNKVGPEGEGTPERYTSDAIANTQLAMGVIQAIPANKTMISNLPADHLLEAPPSGAASKLTPSTGGPLQPPVLCDGWRNPIILAPAAGIWVTVSDPNTPGKVYAKLIKSPDSRPFWVSAGADGMITDPQGLKAYGEDNIYSFEH